MNTPNNKRGQETVQKIEEAFVTLLQEKLLHEVEVSELCELAQINRSTFYAHYNDVEALANAFAEKTEKILSNTCPLFKLLTTEQASGIMTAIKYSSKCV